MKSRRALVFLFLVLATVAGCDSKAFQKNPGEGTDFAKVKLGMSQAEAMNEAPGRGFGRGYDQLPLRPTPRERYPGLPEKMDWFVWQGTDTEPIMVIGIAEGKVAFKEVVVRSGNTGTSESAAIPEYHYKKKK
jgi:hypothetical protein